MQATYAQPAPPSPEGTEVMIRVEGLDFFYGERQVLRGLHLSVRTGEVLGLLGPNGSGKSTLMGLMATLLPAPAGTIHLDGLDPCQDGDGVRRRLGVAFQSPSLDPKLTVAENLRFQGYLFGLRGRALRERMAAMLARFRIAERSTERVEQLSGGLRRRVELAKALLHRPPILLLDEPSTGLDPAARLDFWHALEELRRDETLTVLVATHLMDEADRCDRVALIDEGQLVVVDSPQALKAQVGGTVITLESADPAALQAALVEQGTPAELHEGAVRIAQGEGLGALPRLLADHESRIRALHLGRPTLEDVFLARTGHRIDQGAA